MGYVWIASLVVPILLKVPDSARTKVLKFITPLLNHVMVKISNDQEMTQSELIFHSKKVGENTKLTITCLYKENKSQALLAPNSH